MKAATLREGRLASSECWGRAAVFTLCAALTGCTIDVRPWPPTPPKKTVKHTKKKGVHRLAAAEGTLIVSPAWLEEYNNLKAEHGGYDIQDDTKIQVTSDGKIKVPKSVVKHFSDLSKAPARPSETNPP